MNIIIPEEGIECRKEISLIDLNTSTDPIKLLWYVRENLINEVLEYVGLQVNFEVTDYDYQWSKFIKVTLKPLVKENKLDFRHVSECSENGKDE